MSECRCDYETRSDVDLKQRGAGPAFASALAGVAGAAVIQRGAEALFR